MGENGMQLFMKKKHSCSCNEISVSLHYHCNGIAYNASQTIIPSVANFMDDLFHSTVRLKMSCNPNLYCPSIR